MRRMRNSPTGKGRRKKTNEVGKSTKEEGGDV